MSRAIFEVEEMRECIGSNIAFLRYKKDMTQSSLAERLEMSRGSIANIELGRQRAPVETLWAIASVLGVKLSRLFRGVEV